MPRSSPSREAASVVIVAYHRPSALASLLASLPTRALEVIVVNVDGDTEVCATALKHAPDARVIAVPNRGFASGVNTGVAASSRPQVVVCNDDVVFEAGAIDALLACVADWGGVAAPMVLDESDCVQGSIFPHVTLRSLLVEWAILPDRPVPGLQAVGLRPTKWRRPTERELVPGVTACVLACKRRLLVAHPLPEHYFMYWEERDWFTRLGAQSVKVWYEPRARVVHLGGGRDVRDEKQRLLVRNAVMCVLTLHGRSQALLSVPLVVLWQLRLLVQTTIHAVRSKDRRAELAARWVGLIEAFLSVRVALRPRSSGPMDVSE